MVYRKTGEGSTLGLKRTNYLVLIGVLGILVATTVLCVCIAWYGRDIEMSASDKADESTQTVEESAYEDSDITEVAPEKIDFQPVIDKWVKTVGGEKGVVVYDLDRNEMAGGYHADELFATASLYKLFIVYEGYRRVESGEWSIDDSAGFTGYTIGECLDLAIRESYSPCAETLWSMIGEDELDIILEKEYRIEDSLVSDFVATPTDVAKMMQIFYEHKAISDATLLAQVKDSFLNQPETEYNWRQGLPSGFSENVNVYNKVGWEYNDETGMWNIYNDAAIVDFVDSNRHFAVVVMTSGVPYQKIREFGSMLEEYFNENI
ncbi:serine hydrolase [Candidatus Saccharibacteria bacterium]|nr:serine hydrolase [Candidatus Saccharibacteria bacterium]